MMRLHQAMRRLAAVVLLASALLATGCYTTKDHGQGPCKEYEPLCLSGNPVCENDERGCRRCTCSDSPPNSTLNPRDPRVQ